MGRPPGYATVSDVATRRSSQAHRLFFAPSYLKEVDLFIKSKDFTVCLIFFIGIICKALGDQYNYDIVYFIIFIPAVTIGWM